MQAPVDLAKLVENATEMVKKGTELAPNAKEDAKSAGLNALEAVKAAAHTASNLNNLKDGL